MAKTNKLKRKKKLGSKTARAAEIGCLACQIPALKKPENMRLFLSDSGQRALCSNHKKMFWSHVSERLGLAGNAISRCEDDDG